MAAPSVEPPHTLVLSLDYGTSCLAVSYRVFDPSGNKLLDTDAIQLTDGQYEEPQEVAYDGDGSIIFGHQLRVAVAQGRIKAARVFALFKLCLYHDYRTSDIVQKVEQQFHDYGGSLDTLLRDHIAAIILRVKHSMEGGLARLYFEPQQIHAMPVELFLSIPQMWKAPGNLRMTDAAKAAGAQKVGLFYEPQSAAACVLHRIEEMQSIQVGGVVQIADVGGGTGDFVSYEVVNASSGPHITLRLVGQAEGALCGSQFVNIRFENMLKAQPWQFDGKNKSERSFRQRCIDLDIEEAELLKIADQEFEKLKTSFVAGLQNPQNLVVNGSGHGLEDEWRVKISNEMMVSFFQPVIDEILVRMESQLQDKTTTIILVGGMARCPFFTTQVERMFGASYTIISSATSVLNGTHCVSHGAHFRYADIDTSQLRATGTFGVSIDEEVDLAVHPDVFLNVPPLFLPNRHDEALVYTDPIGLTLAKMRWSPMLAPTTPMPANGPYSVEIWQVNYVKPTDTHLVRQIFWTDTNIQAHERMVNLGGETLKPGIEKWGPPIFKERLKWRDLGWEVQRSQWGQRYEIYSRITLTVDGANVSWLWQIVAPGEEPFDPQGNFVPNSNPRFMSCDDADAVCVVDADFNPHPSG